MPNLIHLARTALSTSVLVAVGLASALVACGPGRTTFAAYPSSAPAFDRAASDPKAVEIADKVVTAAGGAERWAAVKEIRWSQAIVPGAGVEPVLLEQAWDRWNGRHHQRLHLKTEPPTDGSAPRPRSVVVMRTLYDKGGTAYGEAGGKRGTLAKEEVERAMTVAHENWLLSTTLLALPFLLEAPGATLTHVGEVPPSSGEGPPLEGLKLTFDPKDPTRTGTYYVMVNRETNLIDRVEIVRAGDPENKRAVFKVGTWVDVSGLKLATVYETPGEAGRGVTFSKIAVSADPDEELYVPSLQ